MWHVGMQWIQTLSEGEQHSQNWTNMFQQVDHQDYVLLSQVVIL